MINSVNLLGHVGKDPEIKPLTNGEGSVCKFTIATHEKWTKDGEKQERTTWHEISMFGKVGEMAAQLIKKGALVYIDGRIRNDSWDDKETGAKKYRSYIIADSFQVAKFAEDKIGFNAAAPSDPMAQGPAPKPKKHVHNYAPGADNSSSEEELPF